jgi:hypothetical protein
MRKAKFRVGQVVFDGHGLSYGILVRRPVKGVWTIACTRGILRRNEYHVAEEFLRPLLQSEISPRKRRKP